MLHLRKHPWITGGLLAILLAIVGTGMAGLWLAGLAHPHAVHAQNRGNADFWFLNGTGAQIDQIYVSPHNQTNWGDDVLGDKAVLPNGIGVLITFSSQNHAFCTLDFKLVYHDESTETYTDGFNTCTLHAVIFTNGTANGY